MSQLFVDNIKGRTGGAIGAPSGVNATGVVTATTFDGSGDELTFTSISASTELLLVMFRLAELLLMKM